MEIKGSYKLIYTIDEILNELVINVELKQITGLIQPFQNIYHGIAYVNGSIYLKKDLSHCIDAKLAAEELGIELKEKLKKKLRKEGKSFRFKKEEIK